MRTGRSAGADRALGGRGRRLNELRGTLTPSRRGAREVWGNPPPACGALWRMAQLGKCARATTRQPAGRLAQGSANLGLSLASRKGALCPTGGFQNALFRHDATAECFFPLRHSSRMRFSVECAFPHLGKRGAASRKGALCNLRLTEKRILRAPRQRQDRAKDVEILEFG